MDYVYVVTVSARGAHEGAFFGTPTAFKEKRAAEGAAHVCRKSIGGTFTLVDPTADFDDAAVGDQSHIIERWDSDEFSVWLERLIFEGKQ